MIYLYAAFLQAEKEAEKEAGKGSGEEDPFHAEPFLKWGNGSLSG
jgi:hypothetical protein